MTDNIILEHHGMLINMKVMQLWLFLELPWILRIMHSKPVWTLDNQKLLKTKLYPKWKEQNLPCFKVESE